MAVVHNFQVEERLAWLGLRKCYPWLAMWFEELKPELEEVNEISVEAQNSQHH